MKPPPGINIRLCVFSILALLSSGGNATEWQFEGTGLFKGWVDRRELVVLHHPWSQSEAGSFIAATTSLRVPEAADGPLTLYFYMTDDYDASEPLRTDSWLGQVQLKGHRFKQVFVDDTLIWERDVTDAEGVGEHSRFAVPLPEGVSPGDDVRVTYRLVDRVGTAERLAGDYRYIGTTDNIAETEPWKLMTNVYIGDVSFVGRGGPQQAPWAERVRRIHGRRWPIPPTSEATAFPIRLNVQGGGDATIPRAVRAGIPLPVGSTKDASAVVLATEKGASLPRQARVMNRWPDGSVRWAEVDTILPEGVDAVLLSVADVPPAKSLSENPKTPTPNPSPEDGGGGCRSGAEPDHPVRVSPVGDNGLRLETKALSFAATREGERLHCVYANGASMIQDLTVQLRAHGIAFYPAVERISKVAAGPVRGEIQIEGQMRDEETAQGRFVIRVAAFAEQPYVRITVRLFHDQPGKTSIERIEMTGIRSGRDGVTAHWSDSGQAHTAEIRIVQLAADGYRVIQDGDREVDSGGAAPGWLGLTSPAQTVLAHIRHFAEQHPTSLTGDGRAIRLVLFDPASGEARYEPHEGEAKRHEIWLGLWDCALERDELRQYAAYFDAPPHFFAADYFCATGGLGMASPHDETRFPELTAFMDRAYGDLGAAQFYATGIRHWGDQVYSVQANTWRNGYYDRQQGFAVEYLMTGDFRWFQHLEACVRHIVDIDVCHASAENPSWVGGIHGYAGADHSTGAPWNPTQRTKGTLAYWRLSGDTDARDAALAVADSAIRAGRGIGAVSVRDHAGILYCLTAAYDETGDPKYLEGARRVAHDAMGRIDRRRGCYAEIHGNSSYRGNVPWMVAQLAQPMYDYYRQSGDPAAAVAVVGMAESIITENCVRGVPGDIYGYSHNPHFKKTSSYHVLIAPALLYAYELSGDEDFLRHARAMYAQTIREGTVNGISNCYWNAGTLLYYLNRYGEQGGVE